MEEREFNDKLNQAEFEKIEKDLGAGNRGYQVLEFMDTSCILNDKYADQLNNLIGTFVEGTRSKLSVKERAELYEKLCEQSLKLNVNTLSLIYKMGKISSLIIDSSDATLRKFMKYLEEHKENAPDYTSFLLNQYIAIQRDDK